MSEDSRQKLDQLQETLKEKMVEKMEAGIFQGNCDDCFTQFDSVGANLKTRRILKGHYGKVYAMHWGGPSESECHKLVSASQDGKLIIWDATSTAKVNAIALRSSWVMTCCMEQSRGELVACGGLDNLCSIYKANDKLPTGASNAKAEYELAQHDGYLSCCRFLDEGRIITSSGDSQCILWDINNVTPLHSFDEHSGDVMSVSVTPTDPNVFVSGSCDCRAIVWDIRQKNHVWKFHGHESDINSVAWMNNGVSFATGSDDSSCRLFDIRTMSGMNVFMDDRILCGITSLEFSKSGRLLFAGYDDFKMRTFESLGNGSCNSNFATVDAHTNRVSCLGVSRDGKAICTGSWDNMLSVLA